MGIISEILSILPSVLFRDQILLKNSKCSESLQNGRERRPRRCEPNATHFVSNGRREREISQSVQNVK
jgi:hypothetical protein